MRIGILTGGGDVPGLNPCIKALVYNAIDEGYEVVGIRRGWYGLLNYNPDDPGSQRNCAMRLTKKIVRTVDRTGGTFLHSSRTNPSNVRAKEIPDFMRGENFDEKQEGAQDFTPHVLRAIEHLGIDALVPIGGDDTLSYSVRMYEEGIPVVAIPKTMDNDVYGTDYCIGFSTAVTRSVNFIHQLRTSTGSHERIAVIELFGRNSGETSLISALLAGVDRAIISEVPFDPHKLGKFLIKDKRDNPSNYAMVTVSEGARMIGGDIVESGPTDAYGHRKLGGIGQIMGEELQRITGIGVVQQQVAYLMRAGAPDSLDLMVAANYANLTMDLIAQRTYGRMVALKDGRYTHVASNIVNQGVKRVNVEAMYDEENYRPRIRAVENKPMFLY